MTKHDLIDIGEILIKLRFTVSEKAWRRTVDLFATELKVRCSDFDREEFEGFVCY